MRTAWHDIWGSARGPVASLAPQARILCGACVFAICMAAPATTWPGIGAVVLAVSTWLALVRPPARLMRSTLLLGLVLFLPYFLLVPFIRSEAGVTGFWDAFAPPWNVLFRGITAMQVSVSTAAALSASALRQGLGRLPIPAVLAAVLIQIVHQTSSLVYETRRVAAAVAVRGGSSGWGTAIKLIGSMPRTWLPRVLDRAERVGAAMELRGYCQRDLAAMGSVASSLTDALAIGIALAGLAGAVSLRLWGGAW